ncbi:MAG: GreA/GreB family elongation factor, partial [Victivallaceae bacterium]
WAENITPARATFCIELAELSIADTPVFRKILSESIKCLMPPYLDKIGFFRALGLRDNAVALKEIAFRHKNLLKLKNGLMVYLYGSARWGKVTSIDGVSASVGISAVSGMGSFAIPLATVLSEAKMFTSDPETLKLSGFDKKSGFSSADYRSIVERKTLSAITDEELKQMACSTLVPSIMAADEFNTWWETAGAVNSSADGLGRRSCDGRSIKEMHLLLCAEAEKTTRGIVLSEAANFEKFFSNLKPAAAVRECKLLAEIISMLTARGPVELLRKVFLPLKDKAPFWPSTLEHLVLEELEVWGEINLKHVENLSWATDMIFPTEYLAGYALELPLRCLNAFCEVVDDHSLFEVIRNTRFCSCDIILWMWRNHKKHGADLMSQINIENTVKALATENLPKAWSASQRELKKQLMDKADFQSQLVDAAGENLMTLTSTLQGASVLNPGERQSLLIKFSRVSKEVKEYLEKGAGEKVLAAGNRDQQIKPNAPQPLFTSLRSHKNLIKELDNIINVHMPENRESLKVARAHGDFRENAEYDAAKERRNFLSRRRSELERDILMVQPVDFKNVKVEEYAVVGSTVTLEHGNGKLEVFYLVGAWDGNPDKNLISYKTRLGEAVVGRKIGEKVTMPNGATAVIKALAPLPEEMTKELAETK